MALQQYINKQILVITGDGRTLTGTLISCDQLTNLVMENTIERLIRSHEEEEASEVVDQGLYLVRGDNVVLCGLVNVELDKSIDWTEVKGGPIGGTKHV